MNEEVVMVPLAAYESQAQHFHQTMRYMIIGWVITVALFVWLGIVMTSYEETIETETVETIETIERVAEADNLGNAVVGDGDISIGDSTQNNYADSQDDQDQDY